MFYESDYSPVLRFGDVVKGYLFTNLTIKEPILKYPSPGFDYDLKVSVPKYSVILTPCCSIDENTISITPLNPIMSSFLKNPFFVEDLTRINRKMLMEQSMIPSKWEELKMEKKLELTNQGKQFVLLKYFIYKDHGLLETYQLKNKDIKHYMIDFKNIQKIKCDLIQRTTGKKSFAQSILSSRILELTPFIREELRQKIALFYSRIPKEDSAIINY